MTIFEDFTEYTTQDFKNLTCREQTFKGIQFAGCNFFKLSAGGSSFAHCQFEDCTFRHCDLNLAVLQHCTFKNATFEDCQLVGINWMATNLAQFKNVFAHPLDFYRCVLNHAIFMGLNLQKVQMVDCIAKNVSFEEADLSHANCQRTEFTGSRFNLTNLTDADFSGARQYMISPTQNTLKKTKFSLPEAITLLDGLDILLVDAPVNEG